MKIDLREGLGESFLDGEFSPFHALCSLGFLNDLGSNLIYLQVLHLLEEVEVLGPKTHELIKRLLLLWLVFRDGLFLIGSVFVLIAGVGREVGWLLFGVLGGGCVVDDAYLLRLYDVLPEDIVIGVASLNILHFGRRPDQAELI